MVKNTTLKIIFNLDGRTNYLHRYFIILKKYKINFDILIINDLENSFPISNIYELNTNIIIKNFDKKITGMNSLFRAMHSFNKIISNYDYVCFVEDDNFIFPHAINKCKDFLDKNKDYVGCNGLSFLFNKNENFEFLNKYNSPAFWSEDIIERAIQYKKNGGLTYYSVFRNKTFIEICKEIALIKDNNLSEIFFNYLVLIKGNLKALNQMYLAREYPRPTIYNIPKLDDWINNNKLIYEINFIVLRLKKQIKNLHKNSNSNLFLKHTLFNYISIRINPFLMKESLNILYKIYKKIYNIKYKRNPTIVNFLFSINNIK